MKFTTGRPNPRSAKPLPVIVKLAGGFSRSIVLGVMTAAPRVSVTVSAALPIRLKELLAVCCQTWAWTVPADSPGTLVVMAVACVGKGDGKSVVSGRRVDRGGGRRIKKKMRCTTG